MVRILPKEATLSVRSRYTIRQLNGHFICNSAQECSSLQCNTVTSLTMLHHFSTLPSSVSLPGKFTNPFHYTPHPLCLEATREVQEYLHTQIQWRKELEEGKMFGVLIVRTTKGEIGYAAAFSGNLAGKNAHPYFVPPVYDLLQPEGFFKTGEAAISSLNTRIQELENDPHYLERQEALASEEQQAGEQLTAAKADLKNAKAARELRRETSLNEKESAALIRESQYQKAEFKRLERYWKERITAARKKVETLTAEIEILKNERKTRSAALQQELFGQFRFLNARHEIRTLDEIFSQTVHKTPPSGAGECAAPKLLQYAYLHGLQPIAMAEFWWGNSPKTEIRHHGYYYPACKGKCEPILQHMLQGLEVEENPAEDTSPDTELEILYEDNWLLVIHKPEGLLSVPGKSDRDSVYQKIKKQYPQATGPLIVHRLDMDTSGLLLIAKTKESHQNLQAQFKNRTVKKRYVALLDGVPSSLQGLIDLPLCPDLLDRPRQMVHDTYGKPALTRYEVLETAPHRTRVALYPLTGRTHQLRVHAAHPLGLNCPILGDPLYGKRARRLFLHAEYLEFRHPISGKRMALEKKADF